MRFDCKFAVFREVETGRDGMNEPVTEAQEIAKGWCAAASVSRERFDALGLSGTVEAVELVVGDAAALRDLRATDRVDLDGVSYRYVSQSARPEARRRFLNLIAVREVAA
ncbi:head-tail adaptor protein [Celeribacter ethanolicus]|uniref:phage head completion protein n=1 Tax=Celeribacter ethanolicus TaxID=1758178 RepID=UPI000832AEED|nr:head-tail adaptor protein [Celeribacter ethanolicus]